MHRFQTRLTQVIWGMFCLSLVSCFGGSSKPARFFMLHPMIASSQDALVESGSPVLQVRLEPVAIPRYLNRPQIVTVKDDSEYHLDEFNLWLEPLGDTLTRVLAENLSQLLGRDKIEILTSSRSADTPVRLTVEVLRLDGRPGKQAVLAARWSLLDRTTNTRILARRTELQEKVNDHSYQSYVEAQNRLLASLSRDMADALRSTVQSQ